MRREPTIADLEADERDARKQLENTMSDPSGVLDGPLEEVDDSDDEGEGLPNVDELKGFAYDLRNDVEAWERACYTLAAARVERVA
jgi:hypothetical protein